MFEKEKENINGPVEFELTNYRFELSLKPITLRGWVSNLDLKQLYKVILDFIVYLDWKYVTTCRRHQPP